MTKSIRRITPRAPRHLSANVVVSCSQHLLVVMLAALLMTAVVATGVDTAFALTRKSVNLDLDGKTRISYSWGAAVTGVLKENKISLDERNKVEPSRAAAPKNGMTTKIQPPRKVIVDLNG